MFFVRVLLLLTPILADSEPLILARYGDEKVQLDSLRAVAIDAGGRFVALSGEPASPGPDYSVQLCDARSGRIIHTLRGHEGSVRSLAFSTRGDQLSTLTADADGNGILRIFETGRGTRMAAIEASGRLIRYLPDGEIAIGGFGRVVRIDPKTQRESARFQTMPIVKDISIDGRFALGVSHHGQHVLEVQNLEEEKSVVRLEGSATEPLVAVFSPDSRTVAAADPRTKSVFVWEVMTGEIVHRIEVGNVIAAIAFSSDGRYLFGGGADQTIGVWEIATGTATGQLDGHSGLVTVLAMGPRERLLSGATDRTAVLWSTGSVRSSSLPRGPLTESQVDELWHQLGGDSAAFAYRAMGQLTANRDAMLPEVLRRVERQLVPVPDADVAKLIAELDHADFRVRERATVELAHASESLRPQLEYALADSKSLEVKARLRLVLRRLSSKPRFDATGIRRLRRVIAVAEADPSDAAERVLQMIAEEFPEAIVSTEARRALMLR